MKSERIDKREYMDDWQGSVVVFHETSKATERKLRRSVDSGIAQEGLGELLGVTVRKDGFKEESGTTTYMNQIISTFIFI